MHVGVFAQRQCWQQAQDRFQLASQALQSSPLGSETQFGGNDDAGRYRRFPYVGDTMCHYALGVTHEIGEDIGVEKEHRSEIDLIRRGIVDHPEILFDRF